ncbi:hypothetical protein CALCODRAFT_467633, partial [Calocera cornea HHB12733]
RPLVDWWVCVSLCACARCPPFAPAIVIALIAVVSNRLLSGASQHILCTAQAIKAAAASDCPYPARSPHRHTTPPLPHPRPTCAPAPGPQPPRAPATPRPSPRQTSSSPRARRQS